MGDEIKQSTSSQADSNSSPSTDTTVPSSPSKPQPSSSSSSSSTSQEPATSSSSSSTPAVESNGKSESLPEPSLSFSERFELGKTLLKQGGTATEKAVEELARALEGMVAEYGEVDIKCAAGYYTYGAALLAHHIQTSSALGQVMKQKQAELPAEERKVIIDEEEEQDEEQEGEGGEQQESADEDLAAAWDVLEVARVIYTKHYEQVTGTSADGSGSSSSSSSSSSSANLPPSNLSEKELGILLAKVYSTIADLGMEKETFDSSYTDYIKCVDLLTKYLTEDDRELAVAHSNCALTALYNDQPTDGLNHYKAAARVFTNRVKSQAAALKQKAQNIDAAKVDQLLFPASTTAGTPATDPEVALAQFTKSLNELITAADAGSVVDEEKKELVECKEILDELNERIVDIEQQLAAPSDAQAMNLLKETLTHSTAMPNNHPFDQPTTTTSQPQFDFSFATSSSQPAASSSTSAAASSSFSFPSSSSSSSSSACGNEEVKEAPVTMLVGKRKNPASATTSAVTSEENKQNTGSAVNGVPASSAGLDKAADQAVNLPQVKRKKVT